MNIYEKIERMSQSELRVAAAKMAELLAGDVSQMDRWASKSDVEGCSTSQGAIMRSRAMVIRRGMSSVGIWI
jgi:hypothetical protein